MWEGTNVFYLKFSSSVQCFHYKSTLTWHYVPILVYLINCTGVESLLAIYLYSQQRRNCHKCESKRHHDLTEVEWKGIRFNSSNDFLQGTRSGSFRILSCFLPNGTHTLPHNQSGAGMNLARLLSQGSCVSGAVSIILPIANLGLRFYPLTKWSSAPPRGSLLSIHGPLSKHPNHRAEGSTRRHWGSCWQGTSWQWLCPLKL